MSTGGEVLLEDIEHFDGGLFDGTAALLLTADEITHLYEAAQMDWSEVEPAIFGTLFERSLDPQKRSQLGAHYTSRTDILRIVEPVVMQPLRRRWDEVRERCRGVPRRPARATAHRDQEARELVDGPITAFLDELHSLRVLDPACGSGNFLYVALQTLKDLEHEVVTFAEQVGSPRLPARRPTAVPRHRDQPLRPRARQHGRVDRVPAVEPRQRHQQRPATRPRAARQHPPARRADERRRHRVRVARGGVHHREPTVHRGKRMRTDLGDEYVDRLFAAYDGRVPREADFVTYWFEQARAQIQDGETRRAGLIATNSIRGGANRRVLQRIKETGDVFMAWSDEPWILEGAAVRVSIIGFDDGSEPSEAPQRST
jgi:type II restriction/modification system DNA methylase subunit YeeA